MNNKPHYPTNIALPLACTLALGVPSLSLLRTLAQDASSEPTKMEKVVVTGSNIPTAATVTASAIEVVSTVDIEKAAMPDMLQLMKKLSTSFAGNGNVGQTINNRDRGGGESNIAIRNLPTLVLLDGRRLANSAFSNGSVVDVNTLPLAMIERVEVLKDGASTIYGSDAIGGVVNIITKKDWNGAEITGRYGFPTGPTSNDLLEYRASLVAGTANEKGSAVAGVSYYHMDPLLTKDRKIASSSLIELAQRGINPPTYVSGSFPGRVGNDVLAGSPFAEGGPGYNPAIVTPPTVGGPFTLAQLEAAGVYIPIDNTPQGALLKANGNASRVLLNTTQFGTISIQAQDRKNAFASFDHDILEKQVRVFGSFFYANNRARGMLAPSPVAALGGAGFNQIAVPANNPYNPFGTALGVGGAGGPRVRTRFVEVGNRIFDSDYNYYRFTGGLKGEFANKYLEGYELAYSYNRSEQAQYTRNGVNGFALNQALTPDMAADPTGKTSTLPDANGNPVPTYNIFALPGFNDPRTIEAIRATAFETGLAELWGFDSVVRGTPIDLPAGGLAYAVGGGYYLESMSLNSDALFQSGNALGLNPHSTFAPRGRSTAAVFAEVLVPIFSPAKNIPGIYGLELTASGRYTMLEPGGTSAVPKVGIRYQPIGEQVTVRGSYSQSFIAPTVYTLFGPPTSDNPNVTINNPVLGNGGGQVTAIYPANPNLPPATADTYTFGVVYSPKQVKNLNFSMDFYRIEEESIGATPDLNAVAASLNALGSASPFASGFRFADNTALLTPAPNQVSFANAGTFTYSYVPGAGQTTDGLDFGLSYVREIENLGKFTFAANANWLLSYYFHGDKTPKYQYRGYYTTGVLGAQGTLADFSIADSLTYELKDFTFTVSSRYIPGVTDPGDLFPSTGLTTNAKTVNGLAWDVPDYWTVDMQIAYEFGKTGNAPSLLKGLRVAFGVNNVSDNSPPFLASSSEDMTDKSTYDIMGRFVYFEMSKKF